MERIHCCSSSEKWILISNCLGFTRLNFQYDLWWQDYEILDSMSNASSLNGWRPKDSQIELLRVTRGSIYWYKKNCESYVSYIYLCSICDVCQCHSLLSLYSRLTEYHSDCQQFFACPVFIASTDVLVSLYLSTHRILEQIR